MATIRLAAISRRTRRRFILDRRRVRANGCRGSVDAIRQRTIGVLPRGLFCGDCCATRSCFGGYGVRTITGFLLQPLNTSVRFGLDGGRAVANFLLDGGGARNSFGGISVDTVLDFGLDIRCRSIDVALNVLNILIQLIDLILYGLEQVGYVTARGMRRNRPRSDVLRLIDQAHPCVAHLLGQ